MRNGAARVPGDASGAYWAMAEHSGTLLAYLDPHFNFIAVNSAYARSSGHPAESLIGRNHFDLFPNPENEVIFTAVRNSGQPAEFRAKPFEYANQPERGMTYWDWVLSPVKDDRGRVTGLVLSLTEVTQAVLAHQGREESEARYRNLFAGMREGFALHEIICDESGKPVDYRFIDANPAFGELTGRDPSAIIGKTVREVMSGTEEYWIATYGNVALTGEPTRFENYARDIGKWFEVVAYRPAAGQFATVFSDITVRRQAAEALQAAASELERRVAERTAELAEANRSLRESEERFRASIENMLDSFVILSSVHDGSGAIVDFRYEYVNEAGCRTTMMSREQLLGKRLLELAPLHRSTGVFDAYRRVVHTGAPWVAQSLDYEDVWAGKPRKRAFDIQATKLGDGLAVAWRDVTEHKRADEALRQLHAELEQHSRTMDEVLSASPDHFYMYDSEGHYLYANRAAADVLQLTQQQIVGRTWQELGMPAPAMLEFERRREGVFATGQSLIDELDYPLPGGEVRHYQYILSPIHDAEGDVTSVVATVRDITESKQQQAALLRSQQQIQAYARQMVDAIEIERRAIARELHDEAGQALTSLKVGIGLLQRDPAFPACLSEQAEKLKTVADEVMRELHGLAVRLRPGALDRQGLLSAVEQYLEQFRQQSGLQVELLIEGFDDERLPSEVEINAYRLVQESLTNVARHSGATRVGVALYLRAGRLLLMVEDDGCGFDVDEAQLRGRLGLVGMRERAEMLGGSLIVESAPGRGTTVIAELPCDCITPDRR